MNDQPGLGPQTPNQNRRNFFLYAAIALLIMMLLNAFVMPMLHGANITEVVSALCTSIPLADERNASTAFATTWVLMPAGSRNTLDSFAISSSSSF